MFILLSQEIMKVIERILHTSFIPKIIPLKLFLDIVPSSSADITRALRACFRGGSVCRFVSKQRPPTVPGFLQYFGHKQGSFVSRYALIHFETLIGV